MSLFKQALDHISLQLPVVIYSKAASNTVVGIFQETSDLHLLSDYSSKGFVFAPFKDAQAVVVPHTASRVSTEEWEPLIVSQKEVFLSFDKQSKESFENLVQSGVKAISDGYFEKIVFSRKETIHRTGYDVIDLYKKLKSNYPTAFCYLFFHPKVGMWMGATPEQLLRVSDQRLYTMALAGTQVNNGQNPVVWGIKEQQEQQFVTDFIQDSLSPYLTGITTSEPFTAHAGSIMHIRTDIEGELRDLGDLKAVIDQLHPTPAVCGMPKEAARNFILSEEGYDRKFYSGYLGELNRDVAMEKDGLSDLFVNLRCMEMDKNQIHLYIGCGITKDSIPADEFMETVHKSRTMKKILEE